MQPEQLVLPVIATLSLGAALLVPLRDDRLGRRATHVGNGTPLRSSFPAIPSSEAPHAAVPDDDLPTTDPSSTATQTSVVAVTAATCRDEAASDAPVPLRHVRPSVTRMLSDAAGRIRSFFAAADGPQLRRNPPDDAISCGGEGIPYDDGQPEESGETIVAERSFAAQLDAFLSSAATSDDRDDQATTTDTTGLIHVVVPTDSAAMSRAQERVVPITRMPLRPHVQAITWPALARTTRPLNSDPERHAFLASAARSPEPDLEAALFAAYREEDPPGRVLALRAIRAGNFPGAEDAFCDAMHVGADEERSYAIDALTERGRRERLRAAFDDRVDAIAAQAALAFVGTYHRADYERELAPFVDHARIEIILALLAGVVE